MSEYLLKVENLRTLLNLEKNKFDKILYQYPNLNKKTRDSFSEIIYISERYILALNNLLNTKEDSEVLAIEKEKIKGVFDYYKQLKEISACYEID